MNRTDEKILKALQEDGRATASGISGSVHLSVPAVAERIRKMENAGVIRGYTVRLDRGKRGYRLLALVFIGLESARDIPVFTKAAVEYPEVLECHHIAGEYDYLLKVLLEDTDALEAFLSKKLKRLPGVRKTNTLIVLSTLKESYNR